MGHSYLSQAGKTRKALAKAKKLGRTRKHQLKLKGSHQANINLSKSPVMNKGKKKLP